MPHGGPDYGINAPPGVVDSIIDQGELAARLGSIDTFDRRGHVVWLDDFEGTINKWDLIPVGVGSGITLSNARARNGARSAQLVTGAALNNTATISRRIPTPVLGRIGFELSFTANPLMNLQVFQIRYYDGGDLYAGEIEIDWTLGTLFYIDEFGAPQALVLTSYLASMPTMFNTLKLVVDLITLQYVSLKINETIYNLNGINLWVAGNLTPPHIAVRHLVQTGVAANQTSYADDAIVTQNEQ